MARVWLVAALFALTTLIACRDEAPATATPAPAPSLAAQPIQAETVSLLTLVRNPSSFENNYVRLNGFYRPFPLLVCESDAHRSPATWALFEDDVEVLASGFDSELRELAYPGMALIVEGRWQHWEGPIGCGRRVPNQQIWYLEVTNIVSPNPLVSAENVSDELAAAFTPTPQAALEEPGTSGAMTATSDRGTAVAVTATSDMATAAAASTQSPASPETLTGTPGPSPTPSFTPVPSPSAAAATVAPSNTVTSVATPATTASATAAEGTGTSTAAATSPPASPEAGEGTIGYDDVVKRNLTAGTMQRWTFVGSTGEIATLSVAPAPGLDVTLELDDPGGTTVATSNQGGAGVPETVNQSSLVMSGAYQIRVTSVGGTAGDYALILQNQDSLPFIVFKENLHYGGGGSDDLTEDVDHFWNFEGSQGDFVSITLTAAESGDLVLYLNGADAVELEFMDENGQGQGEVISDLELPATGYYSIGVGELDFNPASYTLVLELNR
jgi:hypothetical protein